MDAICLPYFPSSSIDVGTVALERLAGKSLWPPIIWFSCYDLVRALEQVCLFLYLPEPHDMAKDSEAVYSQKDLSWKNSMAALSLRIFVFTIL
ncbi:uncharacterized protein LOC141725103 isoform X2 [Apium graveolens]|uniref:uncharacterized protein LOC141725103 isoform X2 n=1 Tax=Apium graveolens TaxID=4045 RepID=UPI003D7BB4BA